MTQLPLNDKGALSSEIAGFLDIVRDVPFLLFDYRDGSLIPDESIKSLLSWYSAYDNFINQVMESTTNEDNPKYVSMLVDVASQLSVISDSLPDPQISLAKQKVLHLRMFANSYGAEESMDLDQEHWPESWRGTGNPFTGELYS